MTKTMMRDDLAACACPQKQADQPPAPGCTAQRLLGESSLLLFVKPKNQRQLPCTKLIYFGTGHICRCRQRITYFQKYGN